MRGCHGMGIGSGNVRGQGTAPFETKTCKLLQEMRQLPIRKQDTGSPEIPGADLSATLTQSLADLTYLLTERQALPHETKAVILQILATYSKKRL